MKELKIDSIPEWNYVSPMTAEGERKLRERIEHLTSQYIALAEKFDKFQEFAEKAQPIIRVLQEEYPELYKEILAKTDVHN